MRVLVILIIIWVIGFIWLLPSAQPTFEYLGKKVDEVKEEVEKQVEEGQVAGEKVLNPDQNLVQVVKVIDGDTIEINSGVKVRFIGVNTPETVDPRRPVQCYGQAAKDFTKSLIEGKTIRMEKDTSETDKYGRLLRYLYVQNADGTETFVNLKLVQEGYAESSSFPPDIKHQLEFQEAQNQAILDNKGLWGMCGSIPKGKTNKK